MIDALPLLEKMQIPSAISGRVSLGVGQTFCESFSEIYGGWEKARNFPKSAGWAEKWRP